MHQRSETRRVTLGVLRFVVMARKTAKTSKDAWKQRYYRENHMSLVDDHLLMQLDQKLIELQICANRINDPSLTRIYNDLNKYAAALLGKVSDFDLQKETLPEYKDSIFSNLEILAAKE